MSDLKPPHTITDSFSGRSRRLLWCPIRCQAPTESAIVASARAAIAKPSASSDGGIQRRPSALFYGFSDFNSLKSKFATMLEVAHAWSADAPSSQLTAVLGGAYDCLVFNAWAGFHPDRLALLSGTIRGGGLLVLVTPSGKDWPVYDDPEYQRLISDIGFEDSIGLNVNAMSEGKPLRNPGNYLQFVVNQLQASLAQGAVELVANTEVPIGNTVTDNAVIDNAVMGNSELSGEVSADFRSVELSHRSVEHSHRSVEHGHSMVPTADQAQVLSGLLKAVLPTLQGSELVGPVCLVGGARGRGKSQVLAYLLSHLMDYALGKNLEVNASQPECSGLRVAIIVPHPSAVATLKHYKPLQEMLTQSLLNGAGADIVLEYYTPVAWLHSNEQNDAIGADILFIEEAAALPFTVLKHLLAFPGPVVMATTTIGYEGSGRVLAEGFVHWLMAQQTDAGREFLRWHLTAPLRWSEDDVVEPVLNKILLLDAQYGRLNQDKHLAKNVTHDQCRLQWLDQAELVQSSDTLESLWAILYGAHYRTRPSDLRAMLDQPGVAILAAYENEVLVGAAWFVEEGPFSAALAAEIAANRRRPKGHLLPQLLALRFGDAEALREKHLRCVRIAVAPTHRRKMVARKMLAAAVEKFSDTVAALGASCALQPDTAFFWRNCGFQLLRLGVKPNARSGAINFAVIYPCSARYRTWVKVHQSLFWENWPLVQKRFAPLETIPLVEQFRVAVDTDTDTDTDTELDISERQAVTRARLFAFARGTAEEADVAGLVGPLLQQECFWAVAGNQKISTPQQLAIKSRVLEGAEWQSLAQQGAFTGRKQGLRCLRQVLLNYLHATEA